MLHYVTVKRTFLISWKENNLEAICGTTRLSYFQRDFFVCLSELQQNAPILCFVNSQLEQVQWKNFFLKKSL